MENNEIIIEELSPEELEVLKDKCLEVGDVDMYMSIIRLEADRAKGDK